MEGCPVSRGTEVQNVCQLMCGVRPLPCHGTFWPSALAPEQSCCTISHGHRWDARRDAALSSRRCLLAQTLALLRLPRRYPSASTSSMPAAVSRTIPAR